MSAAEPKAILRYVEILFAIICFALLADYGLYGKGANDWNAVMAFAILAFIWAIVMVICYLIQRVCIRQIKVVNIVELIIDVLLAVFGVIVSINLAAKLGDFSAYDNRWLRAGRASCAFSFLTTFLLIVSVVLDVISVLKSGPSQTAEAA